MPRVLLNLLGFQTAWWACILSARAEVPWIGLLVSLSVFALHLAASRDRAKEGCFVLLTAVIGYACDTTAVLLGALRFEAPWAVALLPPYWIAALWLAFATTINTTFVWLRARPVWAAALGAVSGPVSYSAGAALGVAVLPIPIWSILVLSLLWASTLSVVAWLAPRIRPFERSGSSRSGQEEGCA